ncbi:MAG: glycoside hydrolase family 43 protein [Verrucomicrobiota bacterium]
MENLPTTEGSTSIIQNPILRGFNPDPSIVRVDNDYYIATSTFEWFPGVQIHHSKDLVNWELVKRPLDRIELLDMRGNPDSGGIWAPCLTHSDGLFYLIYTNVRSWDDGPYKVSYNYLTTAPNIEGPWSDPIFLTGSGFDPSLYHAEDGRKWLLNMIWDHRPSNNSFAGILLQEYCPKARKLVGPVKNIFQGTDLGLVEGPHLYEKDGYYYLVTAEGGTQYEHAATVARSTNIDGPYEVCPHNPLTCAFEAADAPLKKTGHGSLVDTPDGEWYFVHLCGRPIDGKHCPLGRETGIQKVDWPEGEWPALSHGGSVPALKAPAPNRYQAAAKVAAPFSQHVAFDSDQLNIHFQSLRRPFSEDWLSLTARPDWLRLYGQEPTVSRFDQSLIARRLQSFNADVETCIDFTPPTFQQMAGLIAYYDTANHFYLRISQDERLGRSLNIIQCQGRETIMVLTQDISIPDEGLVYLAANIETTYLQFKYSMDGENWTRIGPQLPMKVLSDDYFKLGFTGAFLGLCAQDISCHGHHADYRYFKYSER